MWACDCTSLGGWAPSSRVLPGRHSSPQSQMALASFPHSTRRASAQDLSLPPGEALMRRTHPTLALPRKGFWSQQLLHCFSRRQFRAAALLGRSLPRPERWRQELGAVLLSSCQGIPAPHPPHLEGGLHRVRRSFWLHNWTCRTGTSCPVPDCGVAGCTPIKHQGWQATL